MIEQQYNKVVAQNRSLQSELMVYKKIVKLMLLDLNNGKILIDYHKQAINELERQWDLKKNTLNSKKN